MMNQSYAPIDCGEHDTLLALATLGRTMRCTVLQGNGQIVELEGVIEDVYTTAGAEYFRLRDGTIVRLDRILMLNDRPMGQHA